MASLSSVVGAVNTASKVLSAVDKVASALTKSKTKEKATEGDTKENKAAEETSIQKAAKEERGASDEFYFSDSWLAGAHFISVRVTRNGSVVSSIVEDGTFATYNKVIAPCAVELELAFTGTDATLESYLNQCIKLRNTATTLNIITPSFLFENYSMESFSYDLSMEHGRGVLYVHTRFTEVMELAEDRDWNYITESTYATAKEAEAQGKKTGDDGTNTGSDAEEDANSKGKTAEEIDAEGDVNATDESIAGETAKGAKSGLAYINEQGQRLYKSLETVRTAVKNVSAVYTALKSFELQPASLTNVLSCASDLTNLLENRFSVSLPGVSGQSGIINQVNEIVKDWKYWR